MSRTPARVYVGNKPRKPGAKSEVFGHAAMRDAPYSDEESEFLAAVVAFKAKYGRVFLSNTDTLRMIKEMGYVRVTRTSGGPEPRHADG